MKINGEDIKYNLNILFPNPKCELDFTHDYEFLLSVMLSAQTTDKRVNEVMLPIYKKYNTIEKLNSLSVNEIEEKIKKIGFHKVKSKNFKTILEKLIELKKFPKDRKTLESLPGVGRKTASVVLATLYDIPSFAVDTHVLRVSKRLWITKEYDDVLITENKLKKFFKKEDWNKINSSLVLFGRYICKAKIPNCNDCPFNGKCKVTKNKHK